MTVERRVLIIFCLSNIFVLINCEILTGLYNFTTIGAKQCSSQCYDHGSCMSFVYNRDVLQCFLFFNNVTLDEEHSFKGINQTALKRRMDISDVEAGRCLGHECKEGQTCYFLKDGSHKCLHTECVISPPTVNHSYVIDTDKVYKLKASVHYKCATGYKIFGNNEVFCRAGGTWSKINFVCLDCGQPPVLANSTVANKNVLTTLGRYIYYKCNSGYGQTNKRYRVKCLSNARWSNPSATCKALCPSFPMIPNAEINSTTTSKLRDTQIFYTCNIGYEPPKMWITCLDNTLSNDSLAIWSDPNENCRRVDCGPPYDVMNANYGFVNVTLYQETITYSCNDGMTMTGYVYNSTCQANRTWTETNFVCADCGEAPIPDGASMTVYRGVHSTMSLTCSDDYIATGVVDAKCLNSVWYLGDFNCWWKHCGDPPYLYGAYRGFTGKIVDDTATHICRNDYADVAGVGAVTSTCELGGNWSTVFINCSRKCYTPPTMTNAYYPPDITTYEGSVVFYTCESRFTLVGDRDNGTCLASGVWIGPDFECIPDCRSPQTVSNAQPALYNSTLTPYNALYECEAAHTMIGDFYISCQSNSEWTTEMFICSGCSYPTLLNGTSVIIVRVLGINIVKYSCDANLNLIGDSEITCQVNLIWTEPVFFCTGCADPPSVPNAALHIELLQSDSMVYYDCFDGYNSIGYKHIDCIDNSWTVRRFICTPCTEPTIVQNATYKVEEISNNFEVLYQCDTGLLLIGNKFTTCQVDATWTYPTFICTDCPSAPSVAYAVVNVPLIRHEEQKLTYKCKNKFYLYGPNTVFCQNDTTWSPIMFSCIVCRSPADVIGSTFKYEMVQNKMIYYYECDEGLTLVGDNTLRCISNRAWTPPMFVCTGCSYPTLLAGTSVTIVRISAVNIVTYSCDEGLNLIGNNEITCQESLNWTDPLFFCTECTNPPAVPNAALHIDLLQNDTMVYYNCDTGYNSVGYRYIDCFGSSWTVRRFICTPCTEPPSVQNATYKIEKINNKFEVLYQCDNGLLLIGNKFINCETDVTWKYPTFICTDCSTAPSIPNSVVDVPLIRHDEQLLTYTCINDFHLYGTNIISCQNDTSWSSVMFACIACPYPSNVTGASFKYKMEQNGMIFYYECDEGLTLVGDSTIQCQSNTEWTPQRFICTECSHPIPLNDTSINIIEDSGTYKATYNCNGGANLIGNGVITCQNNLTWTAPLFFCSECFDPPVIPHGNLHIDIIQTDQLVYYDCNEGFNFYGETYIKCQNDDTWTNPKFVCTPCIEPPSVQNASYKIENINSNYEVLYECDGGLLLIGNKFINCQLNGTWTYPTLLCTECPAVPSVQNAAVNVDLIRHDDSKLTYQCLSNFNMYGAHVIDCNINYTWTPTVFACIECVNPGNVTNAVFTFVIENGHMIFYYECEDELHLIGDNSLQCQSTSDWTQQKFACSTCPQPDHISQTSVIVEVSQYNRIVKYQCENGTIGAGNITCQSDLTWTAPYFTCSGCPDPPEIAAAIYSFTTTLDITYLTYECEHGLNLVGNGSFECQNDKTWSQQKFVCTSCSEPSNIMNAMYTVEQLNSTYAVIYNCDDGFNLLGNSVIVCQSGGSWTDFHFICTRCTDPHEIPDASFEVVHGDSNVVYECNVGLNLIGNKNIECQSDGNWTDRSFICTECSEPADVMNAMYTVEKSNSNYTVIYKCDEEFNLLGNNFIECQPDGNWTDHNFVCTKCADLPIIQNTTFKIVHADNNVVYECDIGLNLIGEEKIDCDPDGTWTDRTFVCIECADLPIIQNTTFKIVHADNNVVYECDIGLNLIGEEKIDCDPDGTWTDRTFVCIECTKPPAIINASFKVVPGDNNVVYECNSELNLIGNKNIKCQSDRNWTNPSFICIACIEPPVVKNGSYTFEMVDNNYIARYSCNDGFNLIGNDLIECQLNGSWTDLNLKCTDCSYPPYIQNTTIEVEIIAGDPVVLYSCIPGLSQIGSEYTSCNNKTWTSPSIICSDCSYPPYIQNTTIKVEIIAGDPVVKYSCLPGLTQIGFGYTACDSNTWTLPSFFCSDCGHPPSRPNATLLVQKEQNDIIVNYHCDDGFNITGLPTLLCEMGTWLVGNFTCVSE